MSIIQIANAYGVGDLSKSDSAQLFEERYALYFDGAADLRAESPTHLPLALVAGRLYIYDSADLTTVDDGGTNPRTIVTTNGRRYKLYVETPRPNLLGNSDFQIWERGTSGFTAEGYSADLWRIRPGGGTNRTFEQAAGLTDDAEFSFSYDKQTTSGASDIIEQRLEDVRALAGRTVVASFDAQSFAGDIDIGFDFNQDYDDAGADVSTGDTSRTVTTTLQRFFAIHSIPALDGGRTVGADSYTGFRIFRGAASANGEIRIGNPKVELVEPLALAAPTPYVKPSPVSEWPHARRYAQTLDASVNPFMMFAVGVALNADDAQFVIPLPEKMREAPSLELSATTDFQVLDAGVAVTTPDDIVLGVSDGRTVTVVFEKTAQFTAGDALLLRANNTVNARLTFSSEL